MRKMTCRQLGGACDLEFKAETFEDISEQSKKHGMEMFQKSDPEHLKAIEDMKTKMMDPKQMLEWMEEKKTEFNSLPEEA